MRNILIALFVIGIGWAAWDAFTRVDPEWKKSECYDGISYSLHQRDDARWVICIRNSYMERLAVDFRVEWEGGSENGTGLVSTGQQACFIVKPGENPKATIESLWVVNPKGEIIEKIYECDNE